MDPGRSFGYMFRQRGGLRKILIGGLLFLVPIIGWLFIAGYSVRTIRTVALEDDLLPEWTDWGDLLTKGLLLWVGSLIYSIPVPILERLGAAGDFLASLWGIVVFIVFPAAMIRFAVSDNFGAFFDVREILSFIRENGSDYILVLVLVIVASILSLFGLILIGIGFLFSLFWALLVSAHLYGALYRVDQARTVGQG